MPPTLDTADLIKCLCPQHCYTDFVFVPGQDPREGYHTDPCDTDCPETS